MDKNLGLRIKEARKHQKLTQSELAKLVNVSHFVVVSNWESGKHEPDFQTIKRIAKVCNTSISYLMGETDDPAPVKIEPGKHYTQYANQPAPIEATELLYRAAKDVKRETIEEPKQSYPQASEPQKTDLEKILEKFAIELHDEFDIPVYSGVRASPQGTPLYEDHIDTIRVKKRWKNCIALRVQGESMMEAHILPGDDVIVCKELEPQNGDTVIVYNGDQEYLIKKLWRIRGKLYLGATKQNCFPIGNYHVLGRVVEIRRKV